MSLKIQLLINKKRIILSFQIFLFYCFFSTQNNKSKEQIDDGRRRTQSSIDPGEYLKQIGKRDLKLSILLTGNCIEESEKSQKFKKAIEKHRTNSIQSLTQSNISLIANSAMRSSFFTPNHPTLKQQVPFSEMINGKINQNVRKSSSQTVRKINVSQISQTPSPCEYEIQKGEKYVRSNSPGQAFSKSPRISWVDEKIKKEGTDQTPGPDYSIKKTYVSTSSGVEVKRTLTKQINK